MAVAVALAWVGGCGKDDDEYKPRQLNGCRILEINENSGEVTVTCVIPKRQEEMKLTVKLTNEAEILINGRTAALGDLSPQAGIDAAELRLHGLGPPIRLHLLNQALLL